MCEYQYGGALAQYIIKTNRIYLSEKQSLSNSFLSQHINIVLNLMKARECGTIRANINVRSFRYIT